MDDFQRTSLAEFSRIYLRSRETDRDKPSELPTAHALPPLSENNLAIQIILGMSKNAEVAARMTGS
jgi:hypothetical protein